MDRLPEEMKDFLASPTNCDCIKKQKQINKQERAIENSLIKICELQQRVEELEKSQYNCQYCFNPLDATPPTGIYECPNCLKNFPNTRSVQDILDSEDRLKNLLTALRNNPIIREDVKRIDEVKVWTA